MSEEKLSPSEQRNFKVRRFEGPFYVLRYMYLALSRCLFVRISTRLGLLKRDRAKYVLFHYINLPLRLDNRNSRSQLLRLVTGG